ncbi:MAG: hypothetical protein K8T89_00650 [Planctomycetes bacterium]|nr:hypothetical protein [Planctomycetota bacterium]
MSANSPNAPRRKRPDRKEIPGSFLPEKNPKARTAYLCAIIGLIPLAGLLLGFFAIYFGRQGYYVARSREDGNGLAHSFVSMLLGGLEILTNGIGIPLVAIGLGWI